MTALEETSELDPTLTEEFGDRMLAIMNNALSALLISVGHQVGLFDTLAEGGPGTSAEVATRARCDERYVREWLGGMTAAGIVMHDPKTDTYRLPAEHAAWTTTAAGPQNFARTISFLPMLAEVEQDILQCFRDGGGLSYEKFPRFHALMDADSRAVFDAALLDVVVPMVPGLHERLTAGIDVADVGCGSGHAINVLARAYPASWFAGYDLSEEGIARARTEAEAWGLTNARFEVRDVAVLEEPGQFDFVCAFDAIHDQAFPAKVLEQVHRSLRAGGTFLMVDINASSNVDDNIGHPIAQGFYTFSVFHCMSVSLGQGGVGLGTVWGRQLATSMLEDAGFSEVEIREIEDDPVNAYYVCRA